MRDSRHLCVVCVWPLFRYFKVGDLYGVSCYEKRLMRGNVELRGVLMSAVGLLSTNYHNHHHHISFLSDQVQYVHLFFLFLFLFNSLFFILYSRN